MVPYMLFTHTTSRRAIEKSGGGEKQLVGCVVFFDHELAAVCSTFVARMPIVPRHSARFWSYAHAALYDGRLTGERHQDVGVRI